MWAYTSKALNEERHEEIHSGQHGRRVDGSREAESQGECGRINAARKEASKADGRWRLFPPLHPHISSFSLFSAIWVPLHPLFYNFILLICLYQEPSPTFFLGPEIQAISGYITLFLTLAGMRHPST